MPLRSKLMSLQDAAQLVRDGDVVGFGGMTLYRKPMAFVRELLRTGRRDLTALGFTCSMDAEMLMAGGALKTLRTCYFGLEYLGLAPALRRAVEQKELEIIEETEYTIALGLQASLMKVPYLPSRDCEVGTDFFDIRPDLKRAPCPVTGDMLTWFPAMAPRVSVIHVPMADRMGNAWLGGQHCVDSQLAMAADCTILTAERIVETAEVQAAQGGAGLVSFMVDAVVAAPGGAHPTSCYPDYAMDVLHVADYLGHARRGDIDGYLGRYIGTSERHYIERVLEEQHVES